MQINGLNVCLGLALTLSIASGVDAREKSRKKPAPKPETITVSTPALTGVSTSTLPGLETAAGPVTADFLIARLREWDDKLESLSAKFKQEVAFGDAGLAQQVEGTINYLRPDRLRIEHTLPARQIVYTDKKTLWIYKPEDSQAVKADWQEWKKQQNVNFTGILDFGSYSALLENNVVSVSTEGKTGTYVDMTFVPKNNPDAYSLTLSLSSTDYFPVVTRLVVGATTVSTTLGDIAINRGLPAEMFDFRPPKGTVILNFPGPEEQK